MTYQNDPNMNRRDDVRGDEMSYTGWIVGGLVALAVILGIFALTNRTDNTDTASNDRPAATAPTTTGSAVQPNNPAGNVQTTTPTQPAPAQPAPAR